MPFFGYRVTELLCNVDDLAFKVADAVRGWEKANVPEAEQRRRVEKMAKDWQTANTTTRIDPEM